MAGTVAVAAVVAAAAVAIDSPGILGDFGCHGYSNLASAANFRSRIPVTRLSEHLRDGVAHGPQSQHGNGLD